MTTDYEPKYFKEICTNLKYGMDRRIAFGQVIPRFRGIVGEAHNNSEAVYVAIFIKVS
jgi:hypothetical protein